MHKIKILCGLVALPYAVGALSPAPEALDSIEAGDSAYRAADFPTTIHIYESLATW